MKPLRRKWSIVAANGLVVAELIGKEVRHFAAPMWL
jgi:hypothetical protein